MKLDVTVAEVAEIINVIRLCEHPGCEHWGRR
jgi:hypothetical protein